jgi:hypothetical protein
MKKTTSHISVCLNTFLALSAACILHACDCNQDVSGTVLDSSTKQPIEGAYVQNAGKNHDHNYTDNKGNFEINSISGGFRGCPAMTVSLTKEGYEIKTVEIEITKHDTIYLESVKTNWKK